MTHLPAHTSRAGLLDQAAAALKHGRPADAQRVLVTLLETHPRDADALRLLGISHHQQARYPAALDCLQRAAGLRPADALIHNNLGSSLRASGNTSDALTAFRHAVTLAPQLAAAWFNLGKTLKLDAQAEPAVEALQRALALAPAHVGARIVLGDTLKQLGRTEQAADCYRETVRRNPQAGIAWHALANLKTLRFSDQEAADLRRALDHPDMPAGERTPARFALAKALDDAGDFAASFQQLRIANTAQRQILPWDARAFSDHISHTLSAFPLGLDRDEDPQRGTEVIFVVSLPRSGSTLAEQILAAHPDVEGAGELADLPAVLDEESARRGSAFPEWAPDASAADWARLGQRYLERTARWRTQRPRFTDKGLRNWPLLGAALAMLPGARIVDCRREPMETGFSCYRQWFARGQAFSYDLADIGAYWQDYARAMGHWQRLAGDRIVQQNYEYLLADPETQTRALLHGCGLPFDAACLQSHQSSRSVRTASAAQVRQPLRRDTARSSDYATWLAPLRDALEAKALNS